MVKKHIRDKNGKATTVWVRPQDKKKSEPKEQMKPMSWDAKVGDLLPDDFWGEDIEYKLYSRMGMQEVKFHDPDLGYGTYYNSENRSINVSTREDLSLFKSLSKEEKIKTMPRLCLDVAHESGHAFHFRKGLITGSFATDRRIVNLMRETEDEVHADPWLTKYAKFREAKRYSLGQMTVTQDVEVLPSDIKNIDDGSVSNKKWKEAFDKHYGIEVPKGSEKLYDVMFGRMLDTLMAADWKYGIGHDINYYIENSRWLDDYDQSPYRYMEWFAHSSENEIIENPYIKAVLPKTNDNWKKLWKELLKK